ncbi:hypothetical protein GGR65_000633 [Xanthomonas sp. 3376]|nr:hypothetical protein [Xanthomonas arboricola]
MVLKTSKFGEMSFEYLTLWSWLCPLSLHRLVG